MSRAENLKKEKKIKNKEEKRLIKESRKHKKEKVKNSLNEDLNKFETNGELKKDKKTAKRICIILIIILTIVFLISLAYFVYDNFIKKGAEITSVVTIENEGFKFNTVDLNSNTRPFAIMIGNTEDAWPQFNINEAMVVYEMPVEAGISRLLAIYKDKPKLEQIGPLRSARHYFLDYVKEYDAIYVHEGHSPRGESEINSRKIDSVEYASGLFYRDQTRWAPHNAITSGERMINAAKEKGFSLTTKTKTPLKYSVFPVELKNSVIATTVESGYSYDGDLKLVYNEKTMKYEKYEFDELVKDAVSKKPLAATNILILKAKTYLLTGYGEGKGRVHVETDRELSGYYFTHGEGVKIKANKKTIDSQTIYTLEDGTELSINDGNTFIFIVPDSKKITIKSGAKVTKAEVDLEENLTEEELNEATRLKTLYLQDYLKENKIKVTKK